MRSVLIRRFEISDQLTHLFNALFWAVLAATGILIGSASRANVEPTHLSIGVHGDLYRARSQNHGDRREDAGVRCRRKSGVRHCFAE